MPTCDTTNRSCDQFPRGIDASLWEGHAFGDSAVSSVVEQLDGPLKDTEACDGSSLGGQLLARWLLEFKPLAVDRVEFGFER